MDRRWFLRNSALLLTSINFLSTEELKAKGYIMRDKMNEIKIAEVDSNFEREKLRFPFGFKGGYLSELWQIITQLKSENGTVGLGLSTQSVLYGDAEVFSEFSESQGNALMFALLGRTLKLIQGKGFVDPIELMDRIVPQVFHQAKELTQNPDLNINFVYNALVSLDNALWMLYAKENGITRFDQLLPKAYNKVFSHKNSRIAVMFQISYDMPLQDIQKAANAGYFIYKIKTGSSGDPSEMLKQDQQRLAQIHDLLKQVRNPHSPNGKVYYTMDANGRYPNKALLRKYLDYAKDIGAFDSILFYEEPFGEDNTENVSDLGLMIACDESLHSSQDAYRKIELGYGAFVLKGIAKTLSLTAQIAAVAKEQGIPCLCSDLTVNPILIDWNKNVAASMAPFPKLGMGLMETNGDMNYKNWDEMLTRHPCAGANWTLVKNGIFELDDDFYNRAGGIFEPSTYYQGLLKDKS